MDEAKEAPLPYKSAYQDSKPSAPDPEPPLDEINDRRMPQEPDAQTTVNTSRIQPSPMREPSANQTVEHASSVNRLPEQYVKQMYDEPPPYHIAVEGSALPSAPPAIQQSFTAHNPAEAISLSLQEPSDDEFKSNDFSDSFNRSNFLRKVFCLILLQLVVITGMLVAVDHQPGIALFIRNHVLLVVIIALVLYVLAAILVHYSEVRQRVPPHNFTFLLMFTMAVFLFLAPMEVFCKGPEMYITMGAIIIVVMVKAVVALQGDYAMWFGFLLCTVLYLLIFGLAYYFFFFTGSTLLFIGITGAMTYTFVLVHTTQRIIQGKHRYEIVPSEWVFAATALYVDCWNFFFMKKGFRFT